MEKIEQSRAFFVLLSSAADGRCSIVLLNTGAKASGLRCQHVRVEGLSALQYELRARCDKTDEVRARISS